MRIAYTNFSTASRALQDTSVAFCFCATSFLAVGQSDRHPSHLVSTCFPCKILVFFSLHTLVKVTRFTGMLRRVGPTLKRFLPQVSNLGHPGLICGLRIGIFLQRKVEIPLSSREESVGKRRNPYSRNPHCANIWDMFPTFPKYHHQTKRSSPFISPTCS